MPALCRLATTARSVETVTGHRLLITLDGDYELVDAVNTDFHNSTVSPKIKALLAIAGKVAESGRTVTTADVEKARFEGATDEEIHDAVLIAAAFCMFNRYVDGLATWTPTDPDLYHAIGERMAHQGYVPPPEPVAAD